MFDIAGLVGLARCEIVLVTGRKKYKAHSKKQRAQQRRREQPSDSRTM
jgi:hypothetical protein